MAETRMMGDSDFNWMVVHDQCSNLVYLYKAIRRWEEIAAADLAAKEPDTSGMSQEQAYWAGEHFNDQAYMLDTALQAMLGSLAVSIFSSVENYFGALCEDRGIGLDARAQWNQKRTKIEASLGIECKDLPGVVAVTKVRILGNCFKHQDATKNDEYVQEFGGVKGEKIDFDAEDWPRLIEATKLFLLAIVERT